MEDIQEYRYKPMPTPPADIIRYAKDKIKNGAHTMKEGYFRRPDLFSYLEQISRWRAENESNYQYLKYLEIEKPKDLGVQQLLQIFRKEKWWVFGRDLLMEFASFNTPLVAPPF